MLIPSNIIFSKIRSGIFIFFISLIFSGQIFSQPDLPNPPANLQTVTAGSLVIPMDNVNQAIVAPFNLKAYGLVNALLQNDIPVKWVIKSGKVKDGIDFSAMASRVYPSTVATAMFDFRSSAFIIDTVYINKPYYTGGQTATQVITAFANNVAVYKLVSDQTVDVRYTLNQKPKIAVLNNVGFQAIQIKMLTAASIPNYTALSAGAFNGLAQCYTFCSEPHWDSNTRNDTTITNRVVSFVLTEV